MRGKGVKFIRKPKAEEFGTVAVFEDLYRNRGIYCSREMG
jgi:hypothetical protein